MYALRFCWILLIPAITAAASAEELRTWTDTSGRTVEAKFVRVFSGKAILEAKDGRSLPVPLSRLSASDRQYIQERTGPDKEATNSGSTRKADHTGSNTDPVTSAVKDAKPSTAKPSDSQKEKLAAAELRRVRDWNFSGGTFKGRFERFFGRQVVIMQANRPRMIDFSALSAADKDFLHRNFEAQGKAAEVPTAVATTNPTAGDNDAAKNALAASLGQLAGALAGGAGANAGTQGASPQGRPLASPFPQGGPPEMGGFAEQMRRQQEQMRQQHERMIQQQEQRRAELEEINRKTRETVAKMEAARRIPPSQRVPPPSAAAANNVSPGATSDSAFNPAATPTAPSPFESPADKPQHGAHSPFAHATPQPTTEPPQPESALAGLSSLFSGAPAGQPSAASPQQGPPRAGPPQYQQVEVIVCGKCNKEQKPGFKAGQRCQHCGVVIDTITDERGEVVDRSVRATGKSIKFWIWVVLTVVGVIGGLVAKVKSG
jgi:hypothetical protein